MKTKLVSIVVLMLMFAAVPAIQGIPQPNDIKEPTTIDFQMGAAKSPGDILIDIDVQTAHGETGSLGAEWDGQYFWSTSRALVNPPHKLFKWDISGNLVATYNQPTQATTAWGLRDLAFDGTFLYGGSEDGFWRIDPADGTSTLMFSPIAPMTLIRALEWIPSEGMFYTGSFSLGWFKFTPDGSQIISMPNPGLTGVYGMALDEGTDMLWIFDQTPAVPNRCTFYEYDYHTQTLTGNSWLVPMLTGTTDQVAGGAFATTDCVEGKAVLGGMAQGTPLDRIFVMELYTANEPPETPAAPEGPSTGFVGVEYDFTATTTDPEGEDIYFMFDWGDGSNSGWLGPFASGATATGSYTWTAEGTYDVTVKAKDIHDGQSGVSAAHEIVISAAAPILEIQEITGGLFKVKTSIKNIGTVAATNVSWSINLDGGLILLGKETTGTIATIAPDGEVDIASKMIIGLGATVITVTADTTEKTQDAKVLLFFIKIV